MRRQPRDYIEPQAVSAAEAAAIMGVHFVMPRRMAEKGLISTHIARESANVDEPERFYALYDSQECDKNYHRYAAKVEARGGKNDRRPRGKLDDREPVIQHLAGVEATVDFDDAVTLGEAAAILCVHHTLVPRMLRDGKIVGRIAWSRRCTGGPRLWIVSRRSCIANLKETKASEAAGTKRGRPRQKLKAK